MKGIEQQITRQQQERLDSVFQLPGVVNTQVTEDDGIAGTNFVGRELETILMMQKEGRKQGQNQQARAQKRDSFIHTFNIT